MAAAGAAPAFILVRHAHAEWPHYEGRDFDRPLTRRGLEQASATGLALRAAGLAPRRVIASAARRTEQTARILMDCLTLPATSLQLMDALYNAAPGALQGALQAALLEGGPVLLVAHNPGISELARRLSGNPTLASMATGEWQVFSSAGEPELRR